MAICDTCGTEGQFRVVSGFYYCNVCDTQSQHAVEEEIELAFEEGGVFTQGREVGARPGRGVISERFRVYRRLNLYNDLLRKQVDELIHLGAPPRLKVAVMELWFKYIDVLELDSEPYGKLPPFCLQEELEMATKKLKEESFSLKKAIYHHIPMRTSTQRMQTRGKRWCESHPLFRYNIPKAPRLDRIGLKEIMSDLSITERDRSTPNSMSSVNSKVGSEVSDAIGMEDFSGFGFGSQSSTLLDSSLLSDHEGTLGVEAGEEFGSFSFTVNASQAELASDSPIETSQPAEQKGEKAEVQQDANERFQHIAGSSIEEVDLTSKVAYQLRSHMEARDITSIEKYVEPVLQMRCSCLVMILYLALIRAGVHHIGVVDLFRFIRQGHLTYREAREVASDDLLKARRNIFHCMTLPEISPPNIAHGAFLKSCAVLCGLLDIKVLPLPQLNYCIARICLDLNLPREIIAFATSLSTRYSLQPEWSLNEPTEFPYLQAPSIPHMEVEACAVIILTLKYLFGFDGHEEYSASLAAEQRSADEKEQRYFVISHWLTQLSRRAHFLRRRGEFFNAHSLEFEHIKSSAYLVRHDAKRRTDFYSRGASFRRCQKFLDDLKIPNKVVSSKVPATSFPMKGTIGHLLKSEGSRDSLGLLEDMTSLKLPPGHEGPRSYQRATRRHSRFYREVHSKQENAEQRLFLRAIDLNYWAFLCLQLMLKKEAYVVKRQTPSGGDASGSFLAPSTNLLTLVKLLGEYCLSSGIMLHWALMRTERRVFSTNV